MEAKDMTITKFHPDVLRAHADFGGDLVSMQKSYEWYDLKKEVADLKAELSLAYLWFSNYETHRLNGCFPWNDDDKRDEP